VSVSLSDFSARAHVHTLGWQRKNHPPPPPPPPPFLLFLLFLVNFQLFLGHTEVSDKDEEGHNEPLHLAPLVMLSVRGLRRRSRTGGVRGLRLVARRIQEGTRGRTSQAHRRAR
jgi:hypothetical protein